MTICHIKSPGAAVGAGRLGGSVHTASRRWLFLRLRELEPNANIMRATKRYGIRESLRLGLAGIFILLLFPAAADDLFYSVGFNSPLNQVGQLPTTGLGYSTPSRIVFGTPTVVSSFGSLTNQPLLFSAIGYQQIQFNLGQGVPDYFVDFDFESHNLNPSLYAFSTLFDMAGAGAQNFYFHGSGHIGVPPANSPYLPGWSDDQLHHIHIGIDLPTSSWTFQLDGGMPATGLFTAVSSDILSMRMNLSTWYQGTTNNPIVQVAIDNVVIGNTVPEPSIAIVSCIGFAGLLLRRWRNRVSTI